jgi:hypothetical protein
MTTEPAAESEKGNLFFRLCSDHLSIEALPRKAVRIDLVKLKNRAITGHEVMFWTPHFAVLKNQDGHEITLRRDGRMIVRKAGSEEVARQSAIRVMSLVQGDPC